MRWIRVGAAALNQTPLDWQGNLRRAKGAVEEARNQGIQLLLLPELSLSGYGCEDTFHSLGHSRRTVELLMELAGATAGMIVVAGAPIRLQHGLYNCACFLGGGKLLGIVPKQNLAGDGIHYEPRWFRAWDAGIAHHNNLGGTEAPFGDWVFDFDGVRLGAEICEDAWVPNRPGLRLAQAGCDIIVNPSASHFSFGKNVTRERIVAESSRAFGCAYIYANLLGNEAGRVVYDGQCFIASSGEMLALGPRFSFKEWTLTSAVIDVDTLRMRRARITSFKQSDEGVHVHHVPWNWTQSPTPPTHDAIKSSPWMINGFVKEEELARAVALGMFDYLRKSRSGGFVVSLSGGADSAAVSVLAALAYRMAAVELGAEETARRLGHLKLNTESFCGGLLQTVYQASKNSSETTRNAARTVAEGVQARHAEWSIDELVDICRNNVEGTLGRMLEWETDDIALQNVQARVRGPGVWMLANVTNSLLLATSNRSEAAVGYATMDGDTCGSLSPIAGVDKNYLRRWLRWCADRGPMGIGPIPALDAVCGLPPTAELRPCEKVQTDESDLMPYDLLDAIERLAIRDRLEPAEVYQMLEETWVPKLGTPEMLGLYIKRFYSLWARNQWKRERFAPAFHLDDSSLDPKTWCRFPILSGGYVDEFKEMG